MQCNADVGPRSSSGRNKNLLGTKQPQPFSMSIQKTGTIVAYARLIGIIALGHLNKKSMSSKYWS